MSRRFTNDSPVTGLRLRCGWLAALLAVVLAGVPAAGRVAAAELAGADARIKAHLSAGEFGPALDLARRGGTRAEQDRRLGQIALAQAQAGARRASLGTVADISDDRVRAGVLEQISSEPIHRRAGFGGAAAADFDSLIDLITSTVGVPNPGWEEDGGLQGATVQRFPGGVYVDASGVLQRISRKDTASRLAAVRKLAAVFGGNRDARRASALRKVSLTRLEKQVQLRWADGREPDEAMRTLAGLQQVKYVLLYPETGDIVLAGPAGDWTANAEGRLVGVDSARPVLQLDDLVVLLRNAFSKDARFGCSITPTQENLARTKAFLAESTKRPLKPYQRDAWLARVRDQLGKQKIDVYGIDPDTRVARVIVEADYRMKLVGMGLEDGVLGVESYLDSIQVGPDAPPPAMNVLRWWFTLNYDAVQTSESRDAFQLVGRGVKVLSENEHLTQQGKRVHTGNSDELTRRFAHSFTEHFEQLAEKYPIYAELKNVFDLALVAALLKAEDAPGRVAWHMTHFGDPEKYVVRRDAAPTEVETVINHRVVGGKHIIAGVSGGVRVDPRELVRRDAIRLDSYGLLDTDRKQSAPDKLPRDAWWWD